MKKPPKRPSMMTIARYNRDMPSKVFEMASQNMTRSEMCRALGITLENFRQFQEKYSEFSNAYKMGKDVFREEMLHKVEEQIYRSVESGTEVKTRNFYTINKDGERVLTSVTEEVKNIPADRSMLKFVAKNLDPEKWGDNKTFDTGAESMQMQGKEWAEYIMQSCGMSDISNAVHLENRGTNLPEQEQTVIDVDDVEVIDGQGGTDETE